MNNFLLLIGLLALFFLLGRFADLVVLNLRELGEKLGIKVFFLGLILGIFTSFPELAIGINSLLDNVAAISLGNLLGGIVVLFGLVMGINLVLNRVVKTDGHILSLAPVLVFLFLPYILGLDGHLGLGDGVALLVIYLLLVFYLYRLQPELSLIPSVDITLPKKIARHIFFIFAGAVMVLLLSNFIVKIAEVLLENFSVSPFLAGILLFSLGTNLPEIMIALRSWKRHVADLSVSNLLGSAMANILIIGFFTLARPFTIGIGSSFWILAGFSALLFVMLAVFHQTGKRYSRYEGLALLAVYFIFVVAQLVISP